MVYFKQGPGMNRCAKSVLSKASVPELKLNYIILNYIKIKARALESNLNSKSDHAT